MKVLTKYTLVSGTALAAVLSVVAWYRVEHLRTELTDDTRRDHRLVGRILELGVADVWIAAGDDPQARQAALDRTQLLIQRANDDDARTHFEWRASSSPAVESQGVEGQEYVSHFPVQAGAASVGVVVARERLEHIERLVRAQVWLSIAGIAAIVVIGMAAALVLGRWLIERPIARLIEQARQLGRGEPAPQQDTGARHLGSDELAELAAELDVAGHALSEALARSSAETEARFRAVEQLRHSDRLSTVGKLAAGIAHELGTPLSIVGGHAQMIADGEVTGEAALESARAIDREVGRIGRIVRQLLDFARRKGPEGTSCAPAEIAQRCASLLAPMAERAHVACDIEATGSSERALIDEDSLQQVLTNLIVNAIQAMPGGGKLRIVVSKERAAPPGSTAGPAPHVRIDVRDTGTGIPDPVKAHMFEPFFTTKQPGDGTGLGLAVVHGIVVDHGGWIAVDAGDHGTTFSIYLREAQS